MGFLGILGLRVAALRVFGLRRAISITSREVGEVFLTLDLGKKRV